MIESMDATKSEGTALFAASAERLLAEGRGEEACSAIKAALETLGEDEGERCKLTVLSFRFIQLPG